MHWPAVMASGWAWGRRLAETRDDVNRLQNLVRTCARCKKVRSGAGFVRSVDEHQARVTGHDITHGVCPQCHAQLLQQKQR